MNKPPSVHPPGHALLRVSHVDRKSTVTAAFATSPMKFLIPRPRGASVAAFTTNFGGGMVAGDTTRLEIQLDPDTRCLVGSQASTKIYRNPSLRPCGHRTVAHVGPRSLLVFAPDSVQAFAESTYLQHQSFHLDTDAGLVLVDWMSAGRSARGERWAFGEFHSRNEVYLGNDLIFVDSLRLKAIDGPLGAPFKTGRFNCIAMVALFGAPLRETTLNLCGQASRQPVSRRPMEGVGPPTPPYTHPPRLHREAPVSAVPTKGAPPSQSVVWSISPHPQGAVLRVAGADVEPVYHWIRDQLQFLQSVLGEAPWARRW